MQTIEKAAKEYSASKSSSEVFQEHHAIDFKAGVEFAQRWIPVEEELPEIRHYLLVMLSDGTIMYAQFNVFGKFVIFWQEGAGREDKSRPVVKWRPIELK